MDQITEKQKKRRQEVKEMLLDYRRALERIENARIQLETLQEIIDSAPVDYRKPKIAGKDRKDLSEKIAEIEKLHKEIDSEWMDSIQELVKIKKVLTLIENPRGFNILFRRYIRCQAWDTIAYEPITDKRWVQRIHDKTLDEIAEKMRGKE